MNCRFCGAASNPRWVGGYLCGTIDGHQSGLCGSLVRYGERIVMVSEIDALKARIDRLEEALDTLTVVIGSTRVSGDFGALQNAMDQALVVLRNKEAKP